MLKKLMIGTALSGLMLSGALAQSAATPPAANSAPAAQQSASGAGEFVSSQKPDQYLASKFKGTDVIGADEQKIGDVADVLFDKDGKIEAYVISVGGFLGMGAKDVALAPSAFQVVKGSNGQSDKLKLPMSKDQLAQAQNFEPYQPPRATTGMAPNGLGSPMGSRSSANTPPASSR
jgi:sporulation protein YlmC with PRC-barrel domain